MICKHFANNVFQQVRAYFSSQPNDFKYLLPIQIILFTFNQQLVHSQTVLTTVMHQQQFNISHLFAHI